MREVHAVEPHSWLSQFLENCLAAYQHRTKKLCEPAIGETSVGQKLDAIIEMLRPLGSLPSDLGLIQNRLEIIHGLVFDLKNPPPQPKPLEVRFMFIVKDDHEPVNFSLKLGTVTDAEGNTIPDAQLDTIVESSDPAVVAVSFDSGTKSGSISFGNPGLASITAQVTSGDKLLGSGAADFTVTVGDPAAISAVDLTFEGLTEA